MKSARIHIRALFAGLAALTFALALAPLPLRAIPLCQSQSEQLKFWGGTLMQIASFHLGAGGDFGALDSRGLDSRSLESMQNLAAQPPQALSATSATTSAFTPMIGASLGVMYANPEDDRELDYGWRVRYLYAYSPKLRRDTHYIGALLYLHPFPNPYHRFSGAIQTHKDCEDRPDGYPTPFSFVLGSGASIVSNHFGQSVGGYIEMGVAFFKWFPLNAELLYRASFYPSNPYHLETITHSLQVVFAFL